MTLTLFLFLGLTAGDPTSAVSVPATAGTNSVPTPAPNPLPAPAARPVEPRHILLRYLDRDHDNRLTAAELPQRMQRSFAKTDANGDGFLDANEILYGHTKVSQQARKIENLRLERSGELAARGPANEVLASTGLRLLHRLDRNGDGFVDGGEAGEAVYAPGELMNQALASAQDAIANTPMESTSSVAPSTGADRGTPNDTNPVPMGAAASPTTEPRSPLRPDGNANAPAGKKGNDLPTAPDILANLDANGDGMLDSSEVVDQLADNFQRLDKDKSGGLDLFEIDRGLRLARLFGIKPKVDPRTYQKEKSAEGAQGVQAPASVDSLKPMESESISTSPNPIRGPI